MPTSDTLRTTILSLNERWNNAFNSGNSAAVAQLYAADATIAPAGSPQISGNDNIRNFWQGLIDNKVSDHKIECLEVSEDGQLAYQRGLWSAGITNPDGSRQAFSGNLAVVYQRQADHGLQVILHIWN